MYFDTKKCLCGKTYKSTVKAYELKSGLFDRKRKLILADGYLEFENKDRRGKEFTRLNKDNITDFKHGTDWIIWYRFIVGRQFSITFKDTANREFKIRFKTYFGLNHHYIQMYSDIVDDIWDYYHQEIVDRYLSRLLNKEELIIQGLRISEQGIRLREQQSLLPWTRIKIKEYYDYFVVYDMNHPESNSSVRYNEYESEILWSIIKENIK